MNLAAPSFHFDQNLREVPDNRAEWDSYLTSLKEQIKNAQEEDQKLPAYEMAGVAARILMNLDLAENYLMKALALSYQNFSKQRLAQNFIRLAHVFQWQKEYQKSHAFFDQARNLMHETGAVDPLWASYHQHLGKLYFDQGYYALAAAEFSAAFDLRTKIQAAADLVSSSRGSLDEALKRGQIKIPTGVLLRRGYLSDAPGIHHAHMRSIQEICSKDHSAEEIGVWGHRPYREDVRHHSIKNDDIWVIDDNGQIEGYAHLKIYFKGDVKKAHVLALYITPKVLGKSLGQGLMKILLEKVKLSGATEVNLESTLTSVKFYQKSGFSENGPQTTVEISGVPVRCIPMKMTMEKR